MKSVTYHLLQGHPGGGGVHESNLTGKYPFFTNLHNPFWKKFAFRYPVSEIISLQKIQNNREIIVYCS